MPSHAAQNGMTSKRMDWLLGQARLPDVCYKSDVLIDCAVKMLLMRKRTCHRGRQFMCLNSPLFFALLQVLDSLQGYALI